MKNVSPTSRLEVIDVMRSFALLGVLLVHISGEFSGWSGIYISPYKLQSLHSEQIDSIVNSVFSFFLFNKSRALFSFLFGAGFYFQLGKAQRNGYNISQKFTKRMATLFIIGLLHAFFLWSGDVLRIYALCGMFLLLIYRWQPKKVFISAILFTVIIPAINVIIRNHTSYNPITPAMQAAMYEGYAGHTFSGLLHANMLRDQAILLNPYCIGGYILPIFGNFLFGYWAMETDLLNRLIHNRKLIKNCVFLSMGISLLFSTTVVDLGIRSVLHYTGYDYAKYLHDIFSFTDPLSQQARAFFNMCIILLVFRSNYRRSKLRLLIPAGRMTLTNYIMHSVLSVILFDGIGFGFISKFGPTLSAMIGVLYFSIQVIYSTWWLRNFSMGPLEYVWRSLIEGKWESMRRIEMPQAAAT